MADAHAHSSAVVLVRRLLWNKPEGVAGRAVPTVVLLGPSGAGKTNAIKAISSRCYSGIIHAGHDFGGAAPESTIDILIDLAIELSRTWPARGTPRFVRFALALLAIHVAVDDRLPDSTRRAIELAVKKFTTNRSPKGLASRIDTFVDATSSVATIFPQAQPLIKLVQPSVKAVLPFLIRAANRRQVQRALTWHA